MTFYLTNEPLFKDILLAAKDDDYELLDETLKSIEMLVVVDFSKYHWDWDPIKEIIDDIRWAMNSYPCPELRYEEIQILYKKLVESSTNQMITGDLKSILIWIYDDMQRTYDNGLMRYNIDLLLSLKDYASFLNSLDKRMKEEKPELYPDYLFLVKEGAKALPFISKIQIVGGNGGRTSFKQDSINDLTNVFSPFFSAFEGLIAMFSAPVEVLEDREKSDKPKTIDVENLEEEALKKAIWELLFKEKWNIESVCRHYSKTIDEIKDILGVDIEL